MASVKVTMDDSILLTIRKLIGGEEQADYFDTDLIVSINTAFAFLTQVGVGPSEGFFVEDDTQKWSDFIGDDKRLNMVFSYVYKKTQLLFDPPSSGVLRENLESQIKEMEWRAHIAADPASYATSESDSP